MPANTKSLLAALLLLDTLLILIGGGQALMGATSWHIDALFGLDGEASIPTWYASMKYFVLAIAAAILAWLLRGDAAANGPFALLALMFLAMSCDEVAAIHEHLQQGVERHAVDPALIASAGRIGIPLEQVAVVLPVLVLASMILFRAIRALAATPAAGRLMLVGFMALASGAVGVDLLHGTLDLSATGNLLSVMLEEWLELAGSSIIIAGCGVALGRFMPAPDGKIGALLQSRGMD